MITVHGRTGLIETKVILPGSKSISNRLLILKHFAGEKLQINNLSPANDTVLLLTILEQIRQFRAKGAIGLLRIDARDAGTVMRFLTSLLAVTPGHYLLTGSPRMLERPIGPLVGALRELGADIEYSNRNGYPPLLIRGRKIAGGDTSIEIGISSQFVSSLMLLGPFLEDGLHVKLYGCPQSWPFAKMTLGLLKQIGVNYSLENNLLTIKPWRPDTYSLESEPDWSSAAFWYSIIALADGGKISFPGLRRTGLQGDERASELFSRLGVKTIEDQGGITITGGGSCTELLEADFTDCPDLLLPVAVTCAGLGTKAVLSGAAALRIKESDRIFALTEELRKLGIIVTTKEDRVFIDRDSVPPTGDAGRYLITSVLQARDSVPRSRDGVPGRDVFNILTAFDHSDHRVAMSLACLAAAGVRVDLNNADVVGKSYPGFWKDLQAAGFHCSFHVDKI